MKSLAAALVVSFAVLSSGSAFAQRVQGTSATYTVEFVDDPLNALGQGTLIPRIEVRPIARKTTLIRPRGSFVTELLKSADTI